MTSLKYLPLLAAATLLCVTPRAFALGAAQATADDASTLESYHDYNPTVPPDCCKYDSPPAQGQNPSGLHVYLFAGLKSHGAGQHDYPQWLADWSKILTEHGAVVDGALHAPSAAELAHTDVVVIFKGDAGFMTPSEHAAFLAFVKRGGGLVSFHDSLCGPDPADMAMLVGGGKRHGQINFTLGAPLTYHVVDSSSPIMRDVPDGLTIYDEAFFKMTWSASPKVHVLATVKIPDTPIAAIGGGVGKVVPQIWTYEHTLPGGQPARAFVWMQGHIYDNFANPTIEDMLLRGIAWAGKRPVNSLVDYKPKRVLRPGRPAFVMHNGHVSFGGAKHHAQ